MRSQICKNKEILCDEIEKLSEERMTDALAVKLSAYRGAYKALCMAEKAWGNEEETPIYPAEKPARTTELDGDSEFERVVMKIPADHAHMVKLTHIFDRHLESLKAVNARAYNSIMEQLKELAKA